MCQSRYWKNIFTFKLPQRDEGIILAAKRQDDIMFSVTVLEDPKETFVIRLYEGIKKLESYRICKCTDVTKCLAHKELFPQHYYKEK